MRTANDLISQTSLRNSPSKVTVESLIHHRKVTGMAQWRRRRCGTGTWFFVGELDVCAEECSVWIYMRDHRLNQNASDLCEAGGPSWSPATSAVEGWVSVASSQQLLEDIFDNTFVWSCGCVTPTACVESLAVVLVYRKQVLFAHWSHLLLLISTCS